ncbi:Rrf2 family transcriptional regulator [Phormidium tenue FACHB-886]|nr:Rrf2 family transcriptional regulator [Phormidium tenue FACHB-886]
MANGYASKEPLKLSEITLKQAIPERYLEQILIHLRHGGIVQSQRGAKGGYVLTREPWRITLLEIVSAIEGDAEQIRLRRRKPKGDSAELTIEKDLVYEVWQQSDAASRAVLNRYTLQDLCQKLEDAKRTDPMYHI